MLIDVALPGARRDISEERRAMFGGRSRPETGSPWQRLRKLPRGFLRSKAPGLELEWSRAEDSFQTVLTKPLNPSPPKAKVVDRKKIAKKKGITASRDLRSM